MSSIEDVAREIDDAYGASPYGEPTAQPQVLAILVKYFGDNDVVTIIARGWWPWFWGAWYGQGLGALGSMALGATIGTARFLVGCVLVQYLIMEPIGRFADLRRKPGEPENIHSASQFAQRIRQEGKGRSKWYQGYNALSRWLACLVTVEVAFVFWPAGWGIAAFMGSGVFTYTFWHFSDRGDHG